MWLIPPFIPLDTSPRLRRILPVPYIHVNPYPSNQKNIFHCCISQNRTSSKRISLMSFSLVLDAVLSHTQDKISLRYFFSSPAQFMFHLALKYLCVIRIHYWWHDCRHCQRWWYTCNILSFFCLFDDFKRLCFSREYCPVFDGFLPVVPSSITRPSSQYSKAFLILHSSRHSNTHQNSQFLVNTILLPSVHSYSFFSIIEFY